MSRHRSRQRRIAPWITIKVMLFRVYVNLPVADLHRSRAFFEALGFSFSNEFSDETALGMHISETVSAMLLTHEKFSQFTPKTIANAHETSEVLIALQVESRAEVDRLIEAAVANGGGKVRDPQDYGFMYGRRFQDHDGHIWEIMWMDPAQMPQKE